MSNRTPVIAGNWKMHTTASTGLELCRALSERIDAIPGVDKAVCPPFPFLEQTRTALAGSTIAVGAQNLHWEEQGAYTGEVSPLMLHGLAEYAIIGHSERRQHFGGTNAAVNRKLPAALRHGLMPILCVGETQEEREAGRTEQLLTGQMRQGLDSVPWTPACVLAYEPVWAIGTGETATPERAVPEIGDQVSDLAAGDAREDKEAGAEEKKRGQPDLDPGRNPHAEGIDGGDEAGEDEGQQ